MTLREELLARARERRSDLLEVEVPGWPQPVYIRSLGAQEGMELLEGVKPKDVAYAVLVATVCDADGQPIFEPGDEAELAGFTLAEINALFIPAARKNGMGADAVAEAVAGFGEPQGDSNSTE